VRPQQNGCGMRTSPSIAPDIERDGYLVLDDFGPMGCAWPECGSWGWLSKIYWKDRIEIQFESLPSTWRKAGFAMFPQK
jgi:hypothetical protein